MDVGLFEHGEEIEHLQVLLSLLCFEFLRTSLLELIYSMASMGAFGIVSDIRRRAPPFGSVLELLPPHSACTG